MPKEKKVSHSPIVRTVGLVVLVLGLVWMLFGAGKYLFVISMDFTPEQISYGQGYSSDCLQQMETSTTGTTPEGCVMEFMGTVQFTDGTVNSYSSETDFMAVAEALRQAQRTGAGLIAISGIAVTALGLALVAVTGSDRPKKKSKRRS